MHGAAASADADSIGRIFIFIVPTKSVFHFETMEMEMNVNGMTETGPSAEEMLEWSRFISAQRKRCPEEV